MTQQTLYNSETLGTIRGKINANFAELYGLTGGTGAGWHGVRVTDPQPLPVDGAWIRKNTNELAYSPDGSTVRVVGTATAPTVLPAFPGADGYGTDTSGGVNRAGVTTIHKVTNLNDSGAGSLRAAVEASGNRVVVFEVSGAINLTTRLIVSNPNLTIAGQTAPAPGIMLTGYGMYLNTSNVIVQHIAVRTNDPDPVNADCIQVYGNDVIVDHVSASWGKDENISVYGNNVTVSNCIIAESLTSGFGGLLIGDDSQYVAVHNNLLISNHMRNPLIKGNTRSAVWNNLFYNSDSEYLAAADPEDAGPFFFAVVSNLFKDGPNSAATYAAVACNVASSKPGSLVYSQGNSYTKTILDSSCTPFLTTTSPVPISGFNVGGVGAAFADGVLAVVGSRPGGRDSVDARLVSEFIAGTGGWKAASPSYPTYAANSRSLTGGQVVTGTPVTWPASPDTVQPSGYTALEEALHALAAAVE